MVNAVAPWVGNARSPCVFSPTASSGLKSWLIFTVHPRQARVVWSPARSVEQVRSGHTSTQMSDGVREGRGTRRIV